MKYKNVVKAQFLNRPNRFIAEVLINEKPEVVHVKNTGRCKEILREGAVVYLEKAENPDRKTAFSLISAYKEGLLINIDSQVPNAVVFDAIKEGLVKEIQETIVLKREVTYGKSRFDLYFENEVGKGFVEVKGATLEKDGVVMFPDAPTERGTKHICEMIKAVEAGYQGYIFFLIQMKEVKFFTPNKEMDVTFSTALKKAQEAGVKILAYSSYVTEDEIILGSKVTVIL